MRDFTYYAPTKIVFGKDTEKQTGNLVKEFGGTRAFVVYGGNSAKKSGLLDKVKESLDSAGVASDFMGGVVPNPRLSLVRKMAAKAIDFKADFIIAVGGGSVHDTAKAVAHAVANPEVDVWDFWLRKVPLTKSMPIGSVLTISAAGSETSDSAVITNDEIEPNTKRGINTDFNRCRFTVMNPEITMSLPKYQIAAGAADIFMHTAERYFTTILGNHLSDEFAEGLFRNIIKYGPVGVEKPDDYEAMSEIMWSGSISHVGITGIGSRGDTGRDGDWGVHQLGMAISAIFDSTHGATLTAVWGTWARYCCSENCSRFAQLGRNVFGVTEADDAKAAEMAICKVEEFFKTLGMPLSLHELLEREVTDDDIEAISQECSYGKSRKIGTFKVLDYDDIKKIYIMAR